VGEKMGCCSEKDDRPFFVLHGRKLTAAGQGRQERVFEKLIHI
jgi:hypothetical protein